MIRVTTPRGLLTPPGFCSDRGQLHLKPPMELVEGASVLPLAFCWSDGLRNREAREDPQKSKGQPRRAVPYGAHPYSVNW